MLQLNGRGHLNVTPWLHCVFETYSAHCVSGDCILKPDFLYFCCEVGTILMINFN